MSKQRKYAPRLHNGDSRVRTFGKLPYHVKVGLKSIAKLEGKSVS